VGHHVPTAEEIALAPNQKQKQKQKKKKKKETQ